MNSEIPLALPRALLDVVAAINAIWLSREHGTMWGASSHHGEEYGIGW